jgi:hypothetical protein
MDENNLILMLLVARQELPVAVLLVKHKEDGHLILHDEAA